MDAPFRTTVQSILALFSLAHADGFRHRTPCPACLLELASHQREPETLQQQQQLC